MITVADVRTHVLAGFIIGTLLFFRYDWLGPEHVTLVISGGLAPEYRPPTLALFAVDDGLDVDESRPSARGVVTGCRCGVRGAGVARVTSRVAIDRWYDVQEPLDAHDVPPTNRNSPAGYRVIHSFKVGLGKGCDND